MQSALPNPGGSLERRGLRKPWSLAGAVRAADAVQVCPFGPTCGGRLLSDKCRTVVLTEGISRCFGGGIVEVRPCSPEGHLSTLWGPRATSGARADGHKQAGFTPAVKRNARRASSAFVQCVLCKRAFGRRRFSLPSINAVGPPACHQTAGPTGRSRRNSLPPSAPPRRASSAFVQCVLCKRAFAPLLSP